MIQLLTLVIFSGTALSQSRKELKQTFKQAERYYLFGEFDLANELYILLDNPQNLNIKYKIGTCYINIPDEKEKAIPYLEAAVRNTSYEAKPTSFREKRAPLEAYFSLAKAYLINNELDKSLKTYQTFRKLATETESKGGMKNVEFIDQEIGACRIAKQFIDNPVKFSKKSLGDNVNQGAMNENPAVSFDGNTIVFTDRRGLTNAILFSRKIRGKWQTPVDITSQLNAGEDCSSCALNNDGTELYLYKADNYDGNIYSSKYVNEKWTPVVRLNRNINTKFYESHASVSSDGKRLYFTSNREGGHGGLDIYVSEKDATGDWGFPVNLGSTINTMFNEDNPFMTKNDSILYFCSEGHNSMGGYDNFKSRMLGTVWQTPQNLGYPVNTTDDDKFFQPYDNGKYAFYSLRNGYKKRDIFLVGLGGIDVNLQYMISGKFMPDDASLTPDKKFKVNILNKVTGDTLYKGSPDISSGTYAINVAPGIFRLVYSGNGYFSQTIDTTVVQDNPEPVIALDVTLKRDTSLIEKYDKINLHEIPFVSEIDSSILIRNLNVQDVSDNEPPEPEILYYTVQVMALYNPVDVSYFKYITDIKVMYNENDMFFRYTTGIFNTKEQANAWKQELLRKGYPDDIWVKKVTK